MKPNYFKYAEEHLFGAKRLVDGLLAEAKSPYIVDSEMRAKLIRPIGLLMGLSIELMLKGSIALHGSVKHVHSLADLRQQEGGEQLMQLLFFHAKEQAAASQCDPNLSTTAKVKAEEAPALVLDYLNCIDALHSKGGNLYRYGGEDAKTPHAPFLLRVLWAACCDLRRDPIAALAPFQAS